MFAAKNFIKWRHCDVADEFCDTPSRGLHGPEFPSSAQIKSILMRPVIFSQFKARAVQKSVTTTLVPAKNQLNVTRYSTTYEKYIDETRLNFCSLRPESFRNLWQQPWCLKKWFKCDLIFGTTIILSTT